MTLIQYFKTKSILKTLSFLALGFVLFSSNLQAASFKVSSNSTGYSELDLTGSTPIILASLGSVACTTWDTNDDKDPDTGCSKNPIPTSNELSICFTHDSATDIEVIAAIDTDNSASITKNSSSATTFPSNSEACINLTWSNVVTSMKAKTNSSCTDNFCNSSFYLYGKASDSSKNFYSEVNLKYSDWSAASFASTSTATCADGSVSDKPCILAFSFLPGDSKAFLYADSGANPVAVNQTGGWPNITGFLPIKYIRFYHSIAASPATVDIEGTNYTDMEIDSTGTFKKDHISGLTNDQKHYFRAAAIDEAGSVGFMMDLATTTALTTPYTNNATPSQVFGVFEESRCFIATAAFGSPLEPKLKQLRDFRDQVLLKYDWGKKFVYWYYETSPQYAAELMDHPNLQKIVRVLIWPLWAFSALSLRVSFEAMAALCFLISFWIFIRVRTRKEARA